MGGATATWRAAPVVLAMLIAQAATAQPPAPPDAVQVEEPPSQGSSTPALQLPDNLVVPRSLLPLVGSMWSRSPTFRRQCGRLAQRPDIVVRFELTASVDRRGGRSRLERRPGRMTAAVQIGLGAPSAYVELIAHELEHVLEQLDGTDLATLERLGVEGVMRGPHEGYDTLRARSIGRAVARESRP
jgi:hypothetical protein